MTEHEKTTLADWAYAEKLPPETLADLLARSESYAEETA